MGSNEQTLLLHWFADNNNLQDLYFEVIFDKIADGELTTQEEVTKAIENFVEGD